MIVPGLRPAAAVDNVEPDEGLPRLPERVAAFVVTYRRRAELRESLAALLAQTRPVDAVVVINNDARDDVRGQVRQEFGDARTLQVIDLAENVGSAGGFAGALFVAGRCGYTWAWLLDDDAIPTPTALEELLKASVEARRNGRPPAMLAPLQFSPGGTFGWARWRDRIVAVPTTQRDGGRPFPIDLAYWAGLLVHTDVVTQIGYPRAEFFRSYADYEYCLRARRAGMEIMAVPSSRVAHHEGLTRTVVRLGRRSVRSAYGPSRYYYDARNSTFTAWHTLGSIRAVLFLLARQLRLTVGDLLYEDEKWRRFACRGRGMIDGLLGRMGRRIDLE
jgi:rhamnopyranosyl-N-acetylglucosaminyl-diphospho-decaprenol beta-1,3/1,4-galactofuranosyltransferase